MDASSLSPAPTRLPTPKDPFARRYGPWALVTGASDGIGRAFARALAERGVSVVLVARREGALAEVAQEVRACGVEARVVVADLSGLAGVQSVVAACASLDVGFLVACAGFGTSGSFLEARLEEELAMVSVNVSACTALTHAFANRFAARGSGGVVLMSSLLAFQGVPRAANYAATKAYVQSLAEGLGPELAAHGVDVVACAPGPIHSGFAGRAGMTMKLAQTPDVVARATLDRIGAARTVRPGWLAKALELALSTLPRRGRVLAIAQVMKGMTHGQP